MKVRLISKSNNKVELENVVDIYIWLSDEERIIVQETIAGFEPVLVAEVQSGGGLAITKEYDDE